ncbi:hypothetical protein NFI96_000362 [Prochilodus magdalenae]|nr:hypothetical protein NFI96_000362 [Prochilodus magdalenae]
MDHKNLAYIKQAKRLNPYQARWSLFFGRFDFVLTYRLGSKNLKPDALSHQWAPPESCPEPEPVLPASHIVAPLHWALETAVEEAQRREPDPEVGPPGTLFVPATTRVFEGFENLASWPSLPLMLQECHSVILTYRVCANHEIVHVLYQEISEKGRAGPCPLKKHQRLDSQWRDICGNTGQFLELSHGRMREH